MRIITDIRTSFPFFDPILKENASLSPKRIRLSPNSAFILGESFPCESTMWNALTFKTQKIFKF